MILSVRFFDQDPPVEEYWHYCLCKYLWNARYIKNIFSYLLQNVTILLPGSL